MDDEAGKNFVETIELLQNLSEQSNIEHTNSSNDDRWFVYDKDGNKVIL